MPAQGSPNQRPPLLAAIDNPAVVVLLVGTLLLLLLLTWGLATGLTLAAPA